MDRHQTPKISGTTRVIGARVLSRSLYQAGTVIDLQRARDGSLASVKVRWDGMNPEPIWYLPHQIDWEPPR